jgi:hypothetical protein
MKHILRLSISLPLESLVNRSYEKTTPHASEIQYLNGGCKCIIQLNF